MITDDYSVAVGQETIGIRPLGKENKFVLVCSFPLTNLSQPPMNTACYRPAGHHLKASGDTS